MKKQSAVFLWLGLLAIIGGAAAYLVCNVDTLNNNQTYSEKTTEEIFLTGPINNSKTYSQTTTLQYSSNVSGGT
jgi:hypothetical protein